MKKANRLHVLAMYHLFHYVLATKERGLVIEPSESWDGLLDFLFGIIGMLDANFCSTCGGLKEHVWVGAFS